MHQGLDISSYQGMSLDFHKLRKDGKRFVYIKATEGTTYVNPYFKEQQTEAKDAGMHTGFYHYITPGVSTAELEASHFYDCVKGVTAGKMNISRLLRLAVDCEFTKEHTQLQTLRYIEEFCQHLASLAHHLPVIYTYPEFLSDWGTTLPPEHKLWIADPNGRITPQLPRPFKEYAIWQYNVTGVDKDKAKVLKGLILNRHAY